MHDASKLSAALVASQTEGGTTTGANYKTSAPAQAAYDSLQSCLGTTKDAATPLEGVTTFSAASMLQKAMAQCDVADKFCATAKEAMIDSMQNSLAEKTAKLEEIAGGMPDGTYWSAGVEEGSGFDVYLRTATTTLLAPGNKGDEVSKLRKQLAKDYHTLVAKGKTLSVPLDSATGDSAIEVIKKALVVEATAILFLHFQAQSSDKIKLRTLVQGALRHLRSEALQFVQLGEDAMMWLPDYMQTRVKQALA
eukprot:CAMPEP_0115319228 /NCGR_PEP_ID=MMETSP0270-20121206/79643_1 /TAXON_ID=71861 /ORGANISM="Scrippsiella trochoidea, Strain CCMP3099" /LENGTH=250 /DNA_ID=CAMNT_0002738885 /DNA_START=14 /DNA_END=762 /DNA_ORIENTATION=+